MPGGPVIKPMEKKASPVDAGKGNFKQTAADEHFIAS